MKPNKYEETHKAFLKAYKRLEKVREELKQLPLRKLKEPFQQGWEVSIRLRDDIARRKDAESIMIAIKIGYRPFSYLAKLAHLKKLRTGEKGYWDRAGKDRCWISYYPEEIRIKVKDYEALPEALQKHFCKHDDSTVHYGKVYTNVYYKICLPNYYTTLKARPNIITHYRVKGGPLEAEEAELEDFLKTYWREWFGAGKWRAANPHGRRRAETKAQIKKVLKGEEEDVYIDFKIKD